MYEYSEECLEQNFTVTVTNMSGDVCLRYENYADNPYAALYGAINAEDEKLNQSRIDE